MKKIVLVLAVIIGILCINKTEKVIIHNINDNRFIKFSKMLEIAQEEGFDYIVTGHYARVCYDENSDKQINSIDEYFLNLGSIKDKL